MADENFILQIGYAGGTLTFPITPKFFPNLSFNWKRDGKEVSVVDTVPVHGWFSEVDQDTNIAQWNILKAIAHNGNFVSMTFKKAGGTVVYTYANATIENLRAPDSDAGFVNHVEFEFSIREERGVTYPGLVNVEHEDEEITETDKDGKVTKKFRRRVLATGVRGNTSNARDFVVALKPTFAHLIRESIRTVNFDGDVEGVWEFDNSDTITGDIRRWKETVVYMPGVRANNWYKTSGIPVLIQGGFSESLLQVSGEIERYDDNFPSGAELVDHFKGSVGASTEVVLADRPQIGGPIVIEWDADDPSEAHVWQLTYSYTLAFGESNPRPQLAPHGRNAWNR